MRRTREGDPAEPVIPYVGPMSPAVAVSDPILTRTFLHELQQLGVDLGRFVEKLPKADVERSDYSRTPGRTARLKVGPFRFGVDTSDGVTLAYGIAVAGWSWEWSFGREEEW